MSEPVEIHVHLPLPDDDEVSDGLVAITKALHESGLADGSAGGLFGGEFGYGADFENDVFRLRRDRADYWCDCGASEPKHAESCDSVTKLRAWLDERNRVGTVCEVIPARGLFPAMESRVWTDTTLDEQEAWTKAHPFPACSCGAERAWTEKNGKPPESDPDHDAYTHALACEWTQSGLPHFMHKPSGSSVRWYKYIGRGMGVEMKGEWPTILKECIDSIRSAK